MNELAGIFKDTRKHLMNGVSHMIPFVVTGGILMAVAVMAYGKVRKTFENKDLKPTDVLACCYEAGREENDR